MSVQSVNRSFQLLDRLASSPGGISDIARAVDLPITTVARLLKTLDALGAVRRGDDGLYEIGPTLLNLASRAGASARIESLDTSRLSMLAFQLGEIVGLAVPSGQDVLYVFQADGPNEIQVRDWTGERVPLHVVSSGLVVLANAEPDDLDRYLSMELRRFTDLTVVDPDQIRQRLDELRRSGYVWTKGEFHAGINSLAAPILGGDDRLVGALHCHGPSYRFPNVGSDRVEAGVSRLAAELSRSLGWTGRHAGTGTRR